MILCYAKILHPPGNTRLRVQQNLERILSVYVRTRGMHMHTQIMALMCSNSWVYLHPRCSGTNYLELN